MNIVYLLTTGGTIEKVYSERTGSVNNVESKIDRYLHALRLPDADIHVVSIMNKDSLEMTDDDRALILEIVRGVLTEKAPIYYGVVAKEYWPPYLASLQSFTISSLSFTRYSAFCGSSLQEKRLRT
jgi:hypothetical protein